MTTDPRAPVSEITEIDEYAIAPHFRAFFRATLWGGFAGGGVFLLLTVPIGISLLIDGEIGGGISFALLPLIISGIGTLAGMVLIGLPLTIFLREYSREFQRTYAIVGAIGGLLLPTIFFGFLDGFHVETLGSAAITLGMFGVLAGGVAGNVWGSWRASLAAARSPDGDPPTNPFHDMIH